jgi:hypothetical protein
VDSSTSPHGPTTQIHHGYTNDAVATQLIAQIAIVVTPAPAQPITAPCVSRSSIAS